MGFSAGIFVVIAMATWFTLAWCDQHVDLHRAVKHQSTLNSAKHRNVVSYTNQWLIKLASNHDARAFVDSLNTQLTRARAKFSHIVHTDIAVVEIDTNDSSTHEIIVMLMSEQRAGNIKWFQRDGENKRKSH